MCFWNSYNYVIMRILNAFTLKLNVNKCLNVTLTFDLCDPISTFYQQIEFYNDICTQNAQ